MPVQPAPVRHPALPVIGVRRLVAGVALALALAGCAATSQADVLRFHAGQPIVRGTVAMQPVRTDMAGSLEFRAQADAVARQLREQGFVPVEDAGAAQFHARIDLTMAERTAAPRQSGLSIGIGGGFGSGNVGIGTSVRVPVGGKPGPEVAVTTTLAVQIRENPGGKAIWEGRASIDSSGRDRMRGTAAAETLAKALFQNFPGPSGKTVRVPAG